MHLFWELNPELIQISEIHRQNIWNTYANVFLDFSVLVNVSFVEIPYPINVVNTDRVTNAEGIHLGSENKLPRCKGATEFLTLCYFFFKLGLGKKSSGFRSPIAYI